MSPRFCGKISKSGPHWCLFGRFSNCGVYVTGDIAESQVLDWGKLCFPLPKAKLPGQNCMGPQGAGHVKWAGRHCSVHPAVSHSGLS